MKRPWFKYFPNDWRGDPLVAACSLHARGLWHELYTLASTCEPFGEVRPGGSIPTLEELAQQCRCTVEDVRRGLAELEARKVFSRRDDGAIYSRKMVRDEARRVQKQACGKLGGNPKLTGKQKHKRKDKQPDKAKDKPNGIWHMASDSSPGSVPSPGDEKSSCASATRSPSGSPPNPEPVVERSVHHEFIAWWCDRFEQVIGRRYPFDQGKDPKSVERLRSKASESLADMKLAAERLLANPFWRGEGIDLGVLLAQYTRLISANEGMQPRGKSASKAAGSDRSGDSTAWDADELARRRREAAAIAAQGPPPKLSDMLQAQRAVST